MRRGLVPCLIVAAAAVPSVASAQGASARLAYDTANLALNGGEGYQTADNKGGTLAWGESYVMISYAAMYRATSDPSYLVALASHARSVLDRRDSVLGWKDYKGKSRPCWQSTKYSDGGEPFCWVVHSGMLTYPMADLARIVGKDPALQSIAVPWGGTLGEAAQQLLAEVQKTLATHEFEWKTGPGSGEGHYIGDPSAPVASVAGKALPLNQMNALGMTLAALADGTGDADAASKAKGMCAYLRHRMIAHGTGMVWTYWGDTWSAGKGEDISHAALNVEFASLCHALGWYFTQPDMVRIARTLVDKVHIDTNTAWNQLDGTGSGNTYRTAVGRWLTVAPFEPRVWAVGANAYRKPDTSPGGADLHALSLVALHAPPVRAHDFYHVDWADLGDTRKATANDANILMDPPSPAQRYAVKLRYKASRAATVGQWDGTVYHDNIVLAPASSLDTGWIPYDPAIYLAYSGTRALFQFHDAFVAGQGIEVQEAAPVVGPSIDTTTLPDGAAGQAWSAQLTGSGDPPLLWRLVQGPKGMTIGLQTGELAWTPSGADAPSASLTIELRNDSGSATRTIAITVTDPNAPEGGTDSGGGPVDGSGGEASVGTDAGDAAPQDGAVADAPGGEAGAQDWAGDSHEEGCSCRTGVGTARGSLAWLAIAALGLSRRRSLRRR